ncbi:MAG TPA: DUF6531 domain-containing protein, partial [Candidatus Goldiibacteriota bacterium]|nr:DUF6531 domain-containing protein [Candidatus Goldiibacteriota bacterium]
MGKRKSFFKMFISVIFFVGFISVLSANAEEYEWAIVESLPAEYIGASVYPVWRNVNTGSWSIGVVDCTFVSSVDDNKTGRVAFGFTQQQLGMHCNDELEVVILARPCGIGDTPNYTELYNNKTLLKTFAVMPQCRDVGKPRKPVEKCETKANPVDPYYGAKYEKITDISIKNPGHNLEFSRIYYSGQISSLTNKTTGNMGGGWRTNYDYYLYAEWELKYTGEQTFEQGKYYLVEGGGGIGGAGSNYEKIKRISIIHPDGGIYDFYQETPASNVYVVPGTGLKVEVLENKYIYYDESDMVYEFSLSGALISIKDKTGKGVRLTYATDNVTVEDEYGRQLIINKTDGYITSVTSNIPGFTGCSYIYSNTRLWKVDRPGEEDAEYFYPYMPPPYISGYITRQIDYRKEGDRKDVVYTVSGDRYTEEKTIHGTKIADFIYNSDGSVSFKDKNESVTMYYNSDAKLIRQDFGYLGEETREYTTGNKLSRKIQRNGTKEEYTYNSANLVETLVTTWNDPVANETRSKTERFYYDSRKNLVKYTDGKNIDTLYEYDGYNRVVKILRAGKVTDYTYNADGTIDTIHDSERLSKKYYYDGYGNVIQIKNNITGNSQYYTYGTGAEYGKVKTSTDEAGQVKTYTYDANFPSKAANVVINKDGESETVLYTYSTADRSKGSIHTVTDSMGTVTYNYDSSSALLTTQQDKAGGIRSYTYDNYGRVKTVSDNSGGYRSYSYDNEYGFMASSTDSKGKTTAYGYDNMGNRVSVTDRNQ